MFDRSVRRPPVSRLAAVLRIFSSRYPASDHSQRCGNELGAARCNLDVDTVQRKGILAVCPARGTALFVGLAILHGALVLSAKPQVGRGQQPSVATEKASRTPAQQKINSQLLSEIYRARGEAPQKGVPPTRTGVKPVTTDEKGRPLVDIRAVVTTTLLKEIDALGGTVVSSSSEYDSTIAWVPFLTLERLAANPSVKAIELPPEAVRR